jgi:S-adenosyl-L-methionine hydrolase (adenosine-forming)
MPTPPTVFFLSDYGTRDEFAGVVHAIVVAGAPPALVVDLTHQIPPFDVRAGSYALRRAVPHLGDGVVLAIVDPGVGTGRRALCLEVESSRNPRYFVGPDNGLLIAAAEWVGNGGITRAVTLGRRPHSADRGDTFDGRDVFAPAVVALCRGAEAIELGPSVEPESLVRLFDGVVEFGRDDEGHSCLRAEVTWVDHFGNVQLAVTRADLRRHGIGTSGAVEIAAPGSEADDGGLPLPSGLVPKGIVVRWVETFAELAQGELGLLVDANGHLAVVAGEASAAHWLNVSAGELVVVTLSGH